LLKTNYSESILGIRKSPNLSADLDSNLNSIIKRHKSDSLLESFDDKRKLIETQTKPIVGKHSNRETQTRDSLNKEYMRDQSVQTDVCEFAKASH
jgi:hypothetical protein